jgi:hypothetical protein
MVVGRKTITPARSDWTASGELDAWKFASANVTITKLCGQTGQTGLSNSRVTSVGLAIYTSNSSGTRPASLIRTGRFVGAPSTTGVFCAADHADHAPRYRVGMDRLATPGRKVELAGRRRQLQGYFELQHVPERVAVIVLYRQHIVAYLGRMTRVAE